MRIRDKEKEKSGQRTSERGNKQNFRNVGIYPGRSRELSRIDE